jgi:hypothetical protein
MPTNTTYLRTTLDLPTPRLDEAQRLLGLRSKPDTVVPPLAELIRHHCINELKNPSFGLADSLSDGKLSGRLWRTGRRLELLPDGVSA